MTTERVQGKSGKWYERTADGWVESEAPAEAATGGAESQEGPGVLASMMRGVAQSPALMPMTRAMGIGGPLTPGRLSVNRTIMNEPDEAAQARLAERSGIEAPTNFAERSAERFGTGLPMTALAGPQALAMGGPKALGMMLISDVVSSMFEQGTQDVGGGPLLQAGAGLVGAIATPSGIADDAMDAARGVNRFSRKVATEAAKEVSVSPAQQKKLASVAADFGMDESAIVGAVKEWQRKMPIDESGGRRFLDQAVEALREARDLFPDPKSRPTVAQILGEIGGSYVAGLEASAARMGDGAKAADIAGRKLRVVQDLEKEWELMVPNAPAKTAQAAVRATRDRMAAEASAAWADVPFEEMPQANMRGLFGATKRLDQVPRADRDFLPKEEIQVVQDLIEKYGRRVPMSEIQSLRSRLYELHRAADSPFADISIRQRSRLAGQLTREVEKIIDGLPQAGSAKYMRARELTRNMHDLLPGGSDAIRALEEVDDPVKMVQRILRSPKEAAIARKALAAEEGGEKILESAAFENLFLGEMDNFTPRSIRMKLNRGHEAYKEIFGEEKLRNIYRMLKKIEIAGRYRAGTPAAVMGTGSAQSPLHILLAGAEAATNPSGAAMGVAGKVMKRVIESVENNEARNAVILEALMDDDTAEFLSAFPTSRALPAWQQQWDKIVARSKMRTKLRSGGVAGRAMGMEPEGNQ